MKLRAWMLQFSLMLLLLLVAVPPTLRAGAAAATAAEAEAEASIGINGQVASTSPELTPIHASGQRFTSSAGDEEEEDTWFNVFSEAMSHPSASTQPRFLVLLLTHDGLANRLRAMADWSVIGEPCVF